MRRGGLLVAAGGALLIALLVARRAGAVAARIPGLSPQQRQMAEVIEREFAAAGYPAVLAAAAIVNAYAESRLNPDAVGDNGCSIGLFQLNACGGAGNGMSAAARRDPVQNTQRIIQVVQTQGTPLLAAVQQGERQVPQLAALFCRYVERPADIAGESNARAALAKRWGLV